MRVYRNEQEVTSQINVFTYVPASQNRPVRNPQQSEWANQYRYWESSLLSTDGRFTPDGALQIPANMGCELIISYQNYRQLTAVFVAQVEPFASMEVVGTEEFSFYSYRGPGYFGLLTPLKNQLAPYGGRHNKFDLSIPAEADYFFLNFPAMPIDAYTMFSGNPYGNIDRPTGGTYRIWGPSTDHVNTMGMPLLGQWTDMDKSGSTTYLPHFEEPNQLSCPEYLVPAGVDYDPCMLQGICSTAILDAIWNTEMTMTMVYLRVTRTSPNVERIPLKMVGPDWQPWDGTLADKDGELAPSADTGEPITGETVSVTPIDLSHTATLTYQIYLPLIHRAPLPPDDPTGCPCGWFASDGRMIDFIPQP
jgi:hypothetical protein